MRAGFASVSGEATHTWTQCVQPQQNSWRALKNWSGATELGRHRVRRHGSLQCGESCGLASYRRLHCFLWPLPRQRHTIDRAQRRTATSGLAWLLHCWSRTSCWVVLPWVGASRRHAGRPGHRALASCHARFARAPARGRRPPGGTLCGKEP